MRDRAGAARLRGPRRTVDRHRARPRQGHRRRADRLPAAQPRRPRSVRRRLRQPGRRDGQRRHHPAVRPRRVRPARRAALQPRRVRRRPRAGRAHRLRPRLLDRRGDPGRHRHVRRARRRVRAEHRCARSATSTPSARPATSTCCARRSATRRSPTWASPTAPRSAPPTPSLFPEKVGRLVLDGALPPDLTSAEASEGQAVGFENALRAYIADCQAGPRCPLDGSVEDGLAQISELFERAEANPLPTGTDRDLTRSLAFYGIALPLYAQSYWPYLTQALTAAIDNERRLDPARSWPTSTPTASPTGRSAPTRPSRSTRSTASTAAPPRTSTRCAPRPPRSRPPPPRSATSSATAAPCARSGPSPRSAASTPTPPRAPRRSSSSAPRTTPRRPTGGPSSWRTSCRPAVLLTYEGEGHTAYGSSNDCIADTVDAYLLTGAVPAEGTRC